MADTVTIPATGTGSATPVIATDDCGAAGHAQIVKLGIATDGSATAIPADATNGLDVDVTRLPALVAGTANIGDVDVLTVPADPFGANADAASATGSISAKLRFIAATGIPLTGTVTTKETRSGTNTTATVAASATVVTLLASNANRLGATIYNDSTALLYVKLGATASATDFTALLSGQVGSIGGYYEVPFGYTGILTGLWASATGNARIGELT